MKLSELISETRVEVEDNVEPYRVADSTYKRFAVEAELEACRRSRMLVDSVTDCICSIDFAPTDETIDLDPRVIFVRRVKTDSRPKPLKPITVRELDEQVPGWDTHTGPPTHVVTDFATGKLRLYPIPEEADTAHLTVIRGPLKDMQATSDQPEIAPRFHRSLKHWMRRCFYLLPDSQIYNKQAADDAEAQFAAEFGARSPAQDEVWIGREYDAGGFEGVY